MSDAGSQKIGKGFQEARQKTLRLGSGSHGVGAEGTIANLMSRLPLHSELLICQSGLILKLSGQAAAIRQFELLWDEKRPFPHLEWEVLEDIEAGPEILTMDQSLSVRVDLATPLMDYTLPIPPDLGLDQPAILQLLDDGGQRQAYAPLLTPWTGPRYSLAKALPLHRASTSVAAVLRRPCDCNQDNQREAALVMPFARDFATCVRCGPPWSMRIPPNPAKQRPDFEHLAMAITSGGIVAAKGLGGFYWYADGSNGGPVNRIREFKENPFRPFVLVYASLDQARQDFVIGENEAAMMSTSAGPALRLFPRATELGKFGWVLGVDVRVGVRLAATPFEYLLSRISYKPLLCTSANDKGLGIATESSEIPDHDGQHAEVDDGLTVINPVEDSIGQFLPKQGFQLLHRSRGFVPESLRLPQPTPVPILALGDPRKGVLALANGDKILLSQPFGDLSLPRPARRCAEWLSRMMDWTGLVPDLLLLDEEAGPWENYFLKVFEGYPNKRIPKSIALASALLGLENHLNDDALVFVWDTELKGGDAGLAFTGGLGNLKPTAATLMAGNLCGMGEVLEKAVRIMGLDSYNPGPATYPNEHLDLIYSEGMKAIGGPTALTVPQWDQTDEGLFVMVVDDTLQDLEKQKNNGVGVPSLALTFLWVLSIAGLALVEWLEQQKPIHFIGGTGSFFGNSILIDGFDQDLVNPIKVPLALPPNGGSVSYGQVVTFVGTVGKEA